EKVPTGWLFCNSLSKELLLLNDDLQITEHIEYDGGWIQDCSMLKPGLIALNDVDQHQIVEFEGPPWQITKITPYPQTWRMGELQRVPEGYEAGFLRETAHEPAMS
ncbi:MAG: hypothetical protein ACRDIB_09250, partial [Ardenticatenaceae bacterium]